MSTCGWGSARELSFLPRKLSAAEVLQLGLLNRVWSPPAFEEELERFTTRLTAAPPLALATMKANYVEFERVELGSMRHVRILKAGENPHFATHGVVAVGSRMLRRAPQHKLPVSTSDPQQ
jgi:enoyl-CoA hydratase/carnithine racemase